MTTIFILISQQDAAFLERIKTLLEGNDLETKKIKLRTLQKRRLESLLKRSKAREF